MNGFNLFNLGLEGRFSKLKNWVGFGREWRHRWLVAGLTGLAGERVWERERRTEKKREIGSGEREWAFCKMFYHWFFGKIFYKFLCTNFGQIENILQLWLYFTCKQTLENRKIFYRKYFTSKQTERKTIQLNEPLGFS